MGKVVPDLNGEILVQNAKKNSKTIEKKTNVQFVSFCWLPLVIEKNPKSNDYPHKDGAG